MFQVNNFQKFLNFFVTKKTLQRSEKYFGILWYSVKKEGIWCVCSDLFIPALVIYFQLTKLGAIRWKTPDRRRMDNHRYI